MYVRAVSRHDGVPSSSEHSYLRDWLLNNRDLMPRQPETVYVGIGEMPVAGLAGASYTSGDGGGRSGFGVARAAAEGSREAAARRGGGQAESGNARARSAAVSVRGVLFSSTWAAREAIERALALPPGEYDVYVGSIDRARIKDVEPGRRATRPSPFLISGAISSR